MKHFYAEICKVDDEQRMVYGYASTEALDVQGEIVTKQAMAAALQDYMRFANIREMHQPSAVGVAKSVEMDDKGTFISARTWLNHLDPEALRTAIPRSVRVSEAPSYGQTVMTYDPGSSGALSYLEAARELARQVLPGGGSAAPAASEG